MGVFLASHMQTLECTGVMSGYTTETRTEKIKKKCLSPSSSSHSHTHTRKAHLPKKKKKKHLFPTRVHREATTCPVSETQSLLLQLIKNYSGPSLSNPQLLLAKSAGSRKRKNGNKFIFLRYPCIQTYISSTFLIQTRIIHGREILNCRTSAQPEL